MAYQLKYFLEYKSLKVGSSDTFRLELWQNTLEVLVAEEIKGGQSPFILEMPELSHKFQVVRGRGGTINLFSDTDFKFFAGLEHIDPQEFKVIHKINSVVDWVGYLNSDMQSEPYDSNQNYLVSTTANDGFSLMDRFRFLQANESKYIGIKSKWEIIQICLNKIGLSYNDIRINLATTYSGFSGDVDKTILNESFINCANFYDEDGLGMTIREVLESILAPYGAFICQSNGSIYITDIHTLAGGGSVTYKTFNSSTYAYISDEIELIEKDIYDVGYFGTGHSIDRSGGTNMQKVIYSPYPVKELLTESIITPDEFTVVPENFSTKDGYNYRTLVGHIIWQNIPLTLSTFEESYYLDGERFVYYRYPQSTADIAVMELITPANYFMNILSAGIQNRGVRTDRYFDGLAFLIEFDVFVKTLSNPYDENLQELISIGTVRHDIKFTIQCGDYYYNQSTDRFTTTFVSNNYIINTANGEWIQNRWIKCGENGVGLLAKIYLPGVDLLLNGNFDFKIWSETKTQLEGRELIANNGVVDETWIKNLKISLVNIDGSEIGDSDSEYIGQLNKLFSQEGDTITLTCGTQSKFSDRAMIMRADGDGYTNINTWTRAGQTYKIEELLLNSLCSNYRVNFVTLNAMRLKNEFSLITVFTDTTFLEANPKLMIKSSSIDYANYAHDISLVEISEDELTIVKE